MSDKYREVPVTDFPGWTRVVDGSNRRYRSPGGQEVSNATFTKLANHARDAGQDEIPEGAVKAAIAHNTGQLAIPMKAASRRTVIGTATPLPNPTPASTPVSPDEEQLQQQQAQTSYQQDIGKKAQPSQRPPASPPPPPPTQNVPDDEPVFIAPDPKLDQSRSRAGNRATPKELADGLYISLSIATSIVALIIRDPYLAMTDLEAKNIAIPAANLLSKTKLNEKFGRLIAESGDWQLLGYALWMYFQRVGEHLRSGGSSGGGGIGGLFSRRPSQQQQPAPPAQSNGHAPQQAPMQGAAMPPSINLSGKTPPGVQRQW
jgi:hypothetical protein